MTMPLFIQSDASLEFGNNTPAQMISTAVENGHDAIGIADRNNTSAIIKFIKECESKNISPYVGVLLPVSAPKRDKVKWALEHQYIIKKLYDTLAVDYPDIESAYDVTKSVAGAIKKAASSKAKNRIDVLNKTLLSHDNFANFNARLLDTPEEVKAWSKLIGKTSFSIESGYLVFVAQSRIGYRNILRMTSVLAIKKQKLIEEGSPDVGSESLSFDDIAEYSEDVLSIDCLDEHSVLGLIPQIQDVELAKRLYSSWGTQSWNIQCLGLGIEIKQSVIDRVNDTFSFDNRRVIPLPNARYTTEEEYENFCLKVAVHRGCKIKDPDFIKPTLNKHIKPNSVVFEYYKELSKSVSALQIHFWASVASADVELNKIRLPNYDMDIQSVIEYAFAHSGVQPNQFDTLELAEKAFDSWIREDAPEGQTFSEFRQKRLNDYCLRQLASTGLDFRLNDEFGDEAEEYREQYTKRFEHEISVIESMGFSGYFLIQYDFVNYARRVGVPVGDGRGSAAGSLVVYCLEITDVDPIAYGLQFERFLNPERVSMPDIDVDFGEGGDFDRDSVLLYISEKYQQSGSQFPSSSQIANIMRYQLKSSISVVCKASGLSMSYERYLGFFITDAEQELGLGASESLNWKDFLSLERTQVAIKKHGWLSKVFKMAQALTGKMSGFGVHAGGVVISPTIIADHAAISCDKEGNFFSQFDKDDIETAGLIKFDALGLKTLSVISEAITQIKLNRQITIDPRRIDRHDAAVFELICDQTLSDVFQLEGNGMRELVGKLRPISIEEIAVLSALFRPGALDSGMVEEYIDVKHGIKSAKYDHPALETVTRDTFGCIVYQEQVMSIVRELSGYSLGEADLLRRAMGKKKIEEMHKQRSVYALRAQQHWKDHYLAIGRKLNLSYELSLNFSDLMAELEHIGIAGFIGEHGHISTEDNVIGLLAKLLNHSQSSSDTLKSRLMDFKYTVQLFKSDYQASINLAVSCALTNAFSKEKIEEVSGRLYYALTQFVRFNQIFNKVEKFAGYGFNKSHAIAYSVITYVTAYLKTHYPAEFYSASLSFKKLAALHPVVVEATQKMGVKLLPPNINKSNLRFSVEGNVSVRYGLEKLRSVANKAKVIVVERAENGPYISIFDFMLRMSRYKSKPDAPAILSMAVSGAFDQFIPKWILRDKTLNGRQYIIWISAIIAKSPFIKSDDNSDIHLKLNDMNEFERGVYFSVLAGKKVIEANNILIANGGDGGDAGASIEVESALAKAKLALLSNKVDSKTLQSSVLAFKDRFEKTDDFSSAGEVISYLLNKYEQHSSSMTPFESYFIILANVTFEDTCVYKNWYAVMQKKLGVPVTETLNAERHASGMYITSTPIKELDIARRVEFEPPSSVIDGCPVPVKVIDSSYDEQSVTTYGIVRNVTLKTVKKETSRWFNEKMLFFDLEDGADTINCMIFGTKPSNKFNDKVIKDGAVILLGGNVSCNDYGMTLNAEAIKRYYPIIDEKLLVVGK